MLLSKDVLVLISANCDLCKHGFAPKTCQLDLGPINFVPDLSALPERTEVKIR
ncbi:hypothetical protein VCR4J5_280005 [Vibrio crassostreae]|uniref:Uncharacterized protein n=1 Tax=Vibrio crassostreae TaxID=246167 RepID=A0ABP1WWI2_9VIBR|nr:hypothetical protein VCR19J5_110006 [Vibrio crassostreae]CDT43106.1 hypothetical protein VCR4J5_280005 [Vibrio crassostreae]